MLFFGYFSSKRKIKRRRPKKKIKKVLIKTKEKSFICATFPLLLKLENERRTTKDCLLTWRQSLDSRIKYLNSFLLFIHVEKI